MNKAMFEIPSRRIALFTRMVSGLAALFLFGGCKTLPTIPTSLQDLAPSYKPTNIYRRDNLLPAQVKRVAVLPLTFSHPTLESGVESLEVVFHAELEKTKRFEVVTVSGDQMRKLTGQRGWKADDLLPPDLFERVREATGADAILFSQLTRYHPYQPISIGWKFCLVVSPTLAATSAEGIKGQIFWSADEVLDAGDPAVANAARFYFLQHVHTDSPASDPSSMQTSPTRFGQYTLATLLDTLPGRTVQIH